MTEDDVLQPSDLDVNLAVGPELCRIVRLGLTNLEPWAIMGREQARQVMAGMRNRYSTKYVPFAKRHDCDEVACFDPTAANAIIVIENYEESGHEVRRRFESFWDWFRSATEDMIAFAELDQP